MTKALTPTEKSKKQRHNIKNVTKNFDYTTIADQLRTVNWRNSSHPLVWLNQFTSAQTTISSSSTDIHSKYHKITCKCVTWLCFSYLNYVICFKEIVQFYNATAMTTRHGFDVAAKIAFVLWRHGRRRNGIMLTIRLVLLCLFLQGSAWIPRARSRSWIERFRIKLPVGLRSLVCEKMSSWRNLVTILNYARRDTYRLVKFQVPRYIVLRWNWWTILW